MTADIQSITTDSKKDKRTSPFTDAANCHGRLFGAWYRITSLPAFSRNVAQLDSRFIERAIRAVKASGKIVPAPCPLQEGAQVYMVGSEQELDRLMCLLKLEIASRKHDLSPDAVEQPL